MSSYIFIMKIKVKELDVGVVIGNWGRIIDIDYSAVRNLFNPDYKFIVKFEKTTKTFTDPNEEFEVINYEEYKTQKEQNLVDESRPQFIDECIKEAPNLELGDFVEKEFNSKNKEKQDMFIRFWLYLKDRYWREGYDAGYEDGSLGK